MTDAWAYPRHAAWDRALHRAPFARLDPDCAKLQPLVRLREWAMHPDGQILYQRPARGARQPMRDPAARAITEA